MISRSGEIAPLSVFKSPSVAPTHGPISLRLLCKLLRADRYVGPEFAVSGPVGDLGEVAGGGLAAGRVPQSAMRAWVSTAGGASPAERARRGPPPWLFPSCGWSARSGEVRGCPAAARRWRAAGRPRGGRRFRGGRRGHEDPRDTP